MCGLVCVLFWVYFMGWVCECVRVGMCFLLGVCVCVCVSVCRLVGVYAYAIEWVSVCVCMGRWVCMCVCAKKDRNKRGTLIVQCPASLAVPT